MKLLFFILFLILSRSAFADIRAVSLSPAISDAIIAIGAADQLCGRSSACNAPEIATVPVAGEFASPNAEMIIRLQPDIILSDAVNPGANWKILQKCPFRTEILPGKRISDFPANLRRLGVIFGQSAAAEISAKHFESEIEKLKVEKPARSIKVLVLFSLFPAVSCGKDSFITEALELAGCESITAKVSGSYFSISPEFILHAAPEAIVIAGIPENTVETFFSRREFQNIPALKEHLVIRIDPDRFCRAGTALPQAIRQLKSQLPIEP